MHKALQTTWTYNLGLHCNNFTAQFACKKKKEGDVSFSAFHD